MRGNRIKRIMAVFSILLGIISIAYSETMRLDIVPQKDRVDVPGEMIVEIKKDVIDLGKGLGRVPAQKVTINSEPIEAVSKKYKLISVERLFSGTRKDIPSEIYIFRFSPGINIDEVVQDCKKDPNVIYAEPNYAMHAIKK